MDIFKCANYECAIQLQKLDHITESMMDSFYIQCEETRLSPVVEESMKELLYQEAVSDLGKKVVAVIQKIIDAIREFCGKMSKAIAGRFAEQDVTEKMELVNKAMQDNPKEASKKVKVNIDQRNKELLDEYIRETVKLERKLMNIKLQAKDGFKFGRGKDAELVIAANEIIHEMDKLDARFDSEFLQENKDLIDMALKDAVRFSDKQMKNVKVDYRAVEQESERVLAEFKKDAQGCDVPVKYNIIQRMANGIGTRVRKFVQHMTTTRKKNLALILGTAMVALGITAYTQYRTNPAVKQGVDNIARDTGLDRRLASLRDRMPKPPTAPAEGG